MKNKTAPNISFNPTGWVFFGTDEFSVKVLETLRERGYLPALVVTVPDQPKGRKLVLTPPPAKLWAEQNNIPVTQPTSLKDLDSNSSPARTESARSGGFVIRNSSFSLVASYGKIIPQAILDLPKVGTLNIHPSLLPKYRGATPLESAILAGDEITGVTIIVLDAQMDHGPILAQKEISLTNWKPFYEELRDKLAEDGANLLLEYLPSWLEGKIKPGEQDHPSATFTIKITKEDGLINFDDQPEINFRKIRALTPWPGAYFFIKKDDHDLRVIIKTAHLANGELILDRVLPEGKKEMDWESFKKGYLNQ
jgi:methionyl-tRNA formyltransferase